LKEEGVDPATHLITPAAKPKKAMPSPMKGSEATVNIKEEPVDIEEEENQAAGGEYNKNGNEDDSAHHADDDGHEIDQVGDVDDVCVILDDDEDEEDIDDEYGQVQKTGGPAIKKEVGDAGGEKASDDTEMQEENTGDTVNIDNDESINLTIGEDEQQLLHDEVI